MRLDAAIKSLTDSVTNKDWAYGPAVQSVLDALTAERQRADDGKEEAGKLEQSLNMANAATQAWKQRAKDAEAELAAMRGAQEPVSDIIRDANRYRFLRDEDSWGEDSDSWDVETRTGLISSQNLVGGLSPDHFDDAIDARMAASDIPFLNPVSELFTRQPKPVVVLNSSAVMSRAYVVKQIEAAGIVVKGGE